MPTVREMRSRVDALMADARAARKEWRRERKNLKKLRRRLSQLKEATEIVQAVAKGVQEKAHAVIEGVVNLCLKTVFPHDPYTFNIVVEPKRGKAEARFVFWRNGEEFDPLEESGGGVVDVAAFALRLAVQALTRPAPRKLLVLDEPFKHLSREHVPAVRELLERLCEDTGTQVVMATHSEELACGKVVRITKTGSPPPAPTPGKREKGKRKS